MFPVYDENGRWPSAFRPWITRTIVAANTLIALFLGFLPGVFVEIIAYQFGLIPALMTGATKIGDGDFVIRPELTFLTYGFIHTKWSHLASNMLVLWVFGDNVEKATGHLRFLLFYFLCQIAGAVIQILSEPGSLVPAIGASAAVSGVVGAYLLVRPHARVVMLVLGVMTINIPAYWVITGWLLWQVAEFLWLGDAANVAYWGHIGGFLMGLLLVVPLRQPNVRIFGERSLKAVWRGGIGRGWIARRLVRAAIDARLDRRHPRL